MYTHAARLNRLNVLRGIHSHTARRTAPRSAASAVLRIRRAVWMPLYSKVHLRRWA